MRWVGAWVWVGVAGVLLAAGRPAAAHETDHFTVPVGQEMAELGPYLNGVFIENLEEAVARLNAQIRRAVENDTWALRKPPRRRGKSAGARNSTKIDPERLIEVCHSPEGVAQATWQAFGAAVDLIEGLEDKLHSKEMAEQYPGKLVAHRSGGNSIYNGLFFPLDPRATVLKPWQASTFKVCGVYLGTDKVGHFTDMGYLYFKQYRAGIRAGEKPEQAMKRAIKLGTGGAFSETGILGNMTAGAYSNGDLASNYVGCLFYRNLTEPVKLKGKEYPPILERDGDYWKISDAVKNDPLFIERFISHHYDEALNPSLYEALTRPTLRKKIEARHDDLMRWYKPLYGDAEPTRFFSDMVRELSTYYGENYGHSGKFEELVGLWNTGSDKQAAADGK